jgi:hypothetical protein
MFKNSFSKNCAGNKMTQKNTCRAGQATDEITLYVHCNAGYLRLQTHGFGIFNNKKNIRDLYRGIDDLKKVYQVRNNIVHDEKVIWLPIPPRVWLGRETFSNIMDLQEVGCEDMDRINVAQGRDKCQALMNAIINLWVS